MSSRLQKIYNEEIKNNLQKKMQYKSSMEVPKITKITINVGLGEAVKDKKVVEAALQDIEKISGQKPVITKAKKSIAAFSLREGMPIGCKVTLRKDKMYEFIDRLVNIALPRIKDFRGLTSKGFDNFGNYSFGIKEHIIFPEVNFDKVEKIRGLDISIIIASLNKDHSLELLKKLNFPFKNERSN